MSGLFIFLVMFLAVVCMVLAISKFNQHPFIVLTVMAWFAEFPQRKSSTR